VIRIHSIVVDVAGAYRAQVLDYGLQPLLLLV
jgi:hypothetical protein